MPDQFDEFGIPIKKPSTQVDEFGIPVKKKVGGEVSAPSASVSSPSGSPSSSGISSLIENFRKTQYKDKPVAESTAPQGAIATPKQTLIEQTSIATKDQRIADKEFKKQRALKNATLSYLKNKGLPEKENTPAYNQQYKKMQDAVDNGNAAIAYDKEGNPGLLHQKGFIEDFMDGLNESANANDEAADFVNNMTTQERLDYVKKINEAKPNEAGFIGSKHGVGKFIGDNALFLGKAIAGSVAGAGLVAAAPETLGGSLAGLPTALAFAFTAPDMANQGAMSETMRRFYKNKQQHPEMSDYDAMAEAEKYGLAVGGTAGIVTNAALMGTKLPLNFSNEGKTVLGNALKHNLESSVHMGAVTAAVEAGKEIEGHAEGYKTTPQEVFNNTVNAFVDNATVGFALNALPQIAQGIFAAPGMIKSALKYTLKDVPQLELNGVLKENVKIGNIDPVTAERVSNDVAEYKSALSKVADGLTPEAEASVAGLIQHRDKLAAEAKTKDETQQPVYEEKIKAVNEQIKKITETNDPYKYEVDEITGKPLSEPNKEVVEPNKIESAVIEINGKEYEGKNHAEAILKAKDAGEDISNVDRKGEGKFKLTDGTIISREEAKTQFGKDRAELLIPQDENSKLADKEYEKLNADQKIVSSKDATAEEPPLPEGETIVTQSGMTESERQQMIAERKGESGLTQSQKTDNDLATAAIKVQKLNRGEKAKAQSDLRQEVRRVNAEAGYEKYRFDGEYVRKKTTVRKGATKGNERWVKVQSITKDIGNQSINEKGVVLRDRSVELQKEFDNLVDVAEGLEIPGADGRNLSVDQIKSAVQDIYDGVPSVAANNVLDVLEKALHTDDFPVRDNFANQRMRLNDVLGVESETNTQPLTEEAINKWLNEEGELTPEQQEVLNKEFENIVYEYPTNDVSEGTLQETKPVVQETGVKEAERKVSEAESKQSDQESEAVSEEAPKEEVITDEDGNEYTSLKRRIYDAEVDAEGKPVIDNSTNKSAQQSADETKAKIESGEITTQEIRDIATALASGTDLPTKLKPAEVEHVLLYDKQTLLKESREIDVKMKDAIAANDEQAQADLLFQKAQNELLRDENYRAARNLHSEWGRQGQAMQLSIDSDYSYEHLKDRIQTVIEGGEIPEGVKAKLKEMSDRITDQQVKIESHEEKIKEHEVKTKELEDAKLKIEEENSLLHAQNKLLEEKVAAKERVYQSKKTDLTQRKTDIKARILAKYKKLSGSANMGINLNLLELAPDIAALGRVFVEEGIVDLDHLVKKIHSELKDSIPELTERIVRDLFSGYGKTLKLSNDPIDIELSKLRAKARVVSGLEDVKQGEAPQKSGLTFREPTEEVKAIKREIMDWMRKLGIDVKKDPEKAWKTALESYKTRVKNRTKYLEGIKEINQIEQHLKDQKRSKLKLDQEGKELKAKQQLEKNRVDGLVKQYEYKSWNAFDKIMHNANKFSRGVLISSPATLVKIFGSVVWRSAMKAPVLTMNYAASKMMPSIAKAEGINSLSDLGSHIANYYGTLFSRENWKGVADAFRNHASTDDLLYSKKQYAEEAYPKVNIADSKNKVKDLMRASFNWTMRVLGKNAALHGAGKTIVSHPEFVSWQKTITKNFERNREAISKDLIKEGLLPEEFKEEDLQEVINQFALMKSLREKFMQDNKIASVQKMAEGYFRNSGNIGIAEGINAMLPITRIGSNYAGEALEQHPVIGAIPQLKNIVNFAFSKDKLTSKQKSNLLRTATNQGVGMMCYVLGGYLYQYINPFYQSTSKKYAEKNGKDLPEEQHNMGVISSIWLHSPYAETMRAGATHRWVWDQYDKMHKTDGVMSKFYNTTVDAMVGNIRGEVASSPYISFDEMVLGQLLKGDGGKAAANFVKGRVPFSTTLEEIAKGKVPVLNKLIPETSEKIGENIGLQKEDMTPYELGVRPKGFVENIKMGVPGWRQQVIKEQLQEKMDKRVEPTKHKTHTEKVEAKQDKKEQENKLKAESARYGIIYKKP